MKKRLIARLDIKGQNLCKGIHLEGLRYLGHVHEFASYYYQNNVDELLYMDAVASLYARNSLHDIVQKTAENIFVPLTVGGGLRSLKDIESILHAGADKVAINTEAVKNHDFVRQAVEAFGASTIAISIVAKKSKKDDRYTCYINNGRDDTKIDVIEWIKQVNDMGAGEIVLTSIDQEGTGKGFDLDLIKQAEKLVDMPLVISGGAGTIDHVIEAAQHNIDGIALASMLHYEAVETMDSSKDIDISSFKIIGDKTKSRAFEPHTIPQIKAALQNHKIDCRV
ncbi:MAG: imidazole glycerol phosphate synthase subunit HisF [Bdellovibrionales bacterium]